MRKIALTEEEHSLLSDFVWDMYAEYSSKENRFSWKSTENADKKQCLGDAVVKVLAALKPPYKPTLAEIATLRELTGVGAWIAKAALVHADGDMNEAARILKDG